MSATTIVAIYAAVVSTAAVLFQIFQWVHGHRHHVEVRIRPAVMAINGTAKAVVTIDAVNHGDHVVHINGAGLDMQNGSGATIVPMQPPGATIPGELAPRASSMTYLVEEEIRSQGIDITKPVSGWVRLDTNDVIRSKAAPLLKG